MLRSVLPIAASLAALVFASDAAAQMAGRIGAGTPSFMSGLATRPGFGAPTGMLFRNAQATAPGGSSRRPSRGYSPNRYGNSSTSGSSNRGAAGFGTAGRAGGYSGYSRLGGRPNIPSSPMRPSGFSGLRR